MGHVKTFDVEWSGEGPPRIKRIHPHIHPCLLCRKIHAYVSHDGKLAPCSFCCTKHVMEPPRS